MSERPKVPFLKAQELIPGGVNITVRAQELYNIKLDLTCLGKIIGGDLQVGVYGRRRDSMAQGSPEGSMYQAGTLSGNPLAMAAGMATLMILKNREIYGTLEEKSRFFLWFT